MNHKHTTILTVVCLACLLTAGGILSAAESPGPDPNMMSPDGTLTLNFLDAPVGEILDYLSQTAGMVIVAETIPDTRINLISKQPLNIDEVIALINTVLNGQGFAVVRTERTLKMVPIEDAKHLNIPVSTGNDPDKIIAGDDVITHIIPIRYANAEKLMEDINPLISSYAVLTSNEASNSLIITDTTANIKRIIQIVKAVDTQMAAVADIRVFHLVYANAANTADLINEVFEQQNQASSRESNNQNPFQRMMGFRGSGGRRGGGDSGSSEAPAAYNIPVIASADERTNTVVVSGPSDVLEVVATVIKELDANPDEERSLFVYTLKNARADNIKEKLNSLFQELQQINNQNAQGISGRGGGTTNVRRSDSSTDVSDEVYIESDEDTNSLLVMTSPKNYEKIKKIIDALDHPVPQVLIKVLLAEITTSDDVDLGLEFSNLNIRNDGDSTLVETDFLPNDLSGSFVSQLIEGDLTVTLRALQEIGKLNILSRPYILTSDNQTATINVGQRFPFITDSRITETGQSINTIQYEDIGIILEVTPNINDEGLVIMDVKPEITTPTTDSVKISDGLDATVFAKRSSVSRVAVRNGQTIVIGGLMQDIDTEEIDQVPILGDLPILGVLFKRTVNTKEKTELLIFLTPQVASDDIELEKISENERGLSDVLQQKENESLKKHMEKQEAVYQSDKKPDDTPEKPDEQEQPDTK